MSAPLEDRLRAYYRDRTEREPLPGTGGNDDDNDNDDRNDQEEDMQRLIAEAETRGGPPVGGRGGWDTAPVRIAAVAALVLALLGVGLVAVSRQDDPGPSTGPDPEVDDDPIVTTTPSTTDQDDTGGEAGTTTTPDTETTTTTEPPADNGRTSVVSSEGELGGWDGNAWVRSDNGWDPTPPGDSYQVVQLDGTSTQVTSQVRTAFCTSDNDQLLDVGIRGTEPSSGGIGVAGVATPVPRPADLLDPAGEVYRTATTEIVDHHLGIQDPAPDVRQVVRADLDGDGRDEVVVVARRRSTEALAGAPVGDYSVVFVRRTDGTEVHTDMVVSSDVVNPGDYLLEFGVTAVADLNGDGRMEVVVGGNGYESGSTVVYEMRDGTLTEVLAKGCGP
jgi:hypothetical protein